jgi:hypothetical protein
MATVVKSDDGKKLMILDNGFAASFKDGKWVNKALFNGYELDQHFTTIQDASEADVIMKEAREALGHLATA